MSYMPLTCYTTNAIDWFKFILSFGVVSGFETAYEKDIHNHEGLALARVRCC